MRRTHTYHIWPRNLDWAEKLALIEKFATQRGMAVDTDGHQHHSVDFNRYESASTHVFADFLVALKKATRFDSFYSEITYKSQEPRKRLKVVLRYRRSDFEVAVEPSDDDLGVAAHHFIKEEFGLSNPFISEPDRPRNLHATIFLGRHFDEDSEQPASKLREFLSLLGFHVLEGDEFRAEPIPEKVKKLIDRQDIYLGLVTGNREHDWLVAESSYALGKPRHVIMIVEKDSNFRPTIHGKDFEHIPIERGAVQQSFIRLLQEFRSVGINGL